MKVVHILVILLNSATFEPITVHILSPHTQGLIALVEMSFFPTPTLSTNGLVKARSSLLNGLVTEGVRCVYKYIVNGMDEPRLNFQHLIL